MGYGYNPIVGENWRYNPEKTFKLSRSKIELFFNCATCFYKDAKLGLRKPPMPGWAINSAVDDLLKKEILDLEKKYKFLKSDNSPSKTLGFKPSKIFKKLLSSLENKISSTNLVPSKI